MCWKVWHNRYSYKYSAEKNEYLVWVLLPFLPPLVTRFLISTLCIQTKTEFEMQSIGLHHCKFIFKKRSMVVENSDLLAFTVTWNITRFGYKHLYKIELSVKRFEWQGAWMCWTMFFTSGKPWTTVRNPSSSVFITKEGILICKQDISAPITNHLCDW